MLPPGRWLSCQYEFFLAILSNRLVIFAEALINWKLVEDKMPWQLVFLLGGGFALAKGTTESHLSDYLGRQLEALGYKADWSIHGGEIGH